MAATVTAFAALAYAFEQATHARATAPLYGPLK